MSDVTSALITDDDCEKIIELCWWHLATCIR